MWPVLQRELREQARQDATYWLRVIAGAVVMLLFWLAWEREANRGQAAGRGYFLGLHRCLFFGIWFVAPILTADCLSRERREGTLGLLFLTPLRPVDVVVGKAFVNALKGLVFVLAAIPVMVVPLLLGGVSWLEIIRWSLLQFSALGLALVAGLAASSVTESWWRARLLAFLFAVLAAGLFVGIYVGVQVIPWRWRGTPAGMPAGLGDQFWAVFGSVVARQGIVYNAGFNGLWQDWSLGGATWSAVRAAGWVLLASWSVVAMSVWLAAEGVRRTWRHEPRSIRAERVVRLFTEVQVGKHWWQRRRAAELDASPVRWLQSRTWTARVGGWALLGVAATLAGTALEAPRDLAQTWLFLGQLVLLGGAAFAGAAGFREERESGALELWLVSPLPTAEMISGRLTGLMMRFLVPGLLILFLPHLRFLWRWHVMQWFVETPRPVSLAVPPVDWLFAGWLVATLIFGTGLALSRLSFITAFVLSWVAHHAPFVMTAVVDWANDQAVEKWKEGIPRWDAVVFQSQLSWTLAAAVSVWGIWYGNRQLAERRFFGRGGSWGLRSAPKPREVGAS